MTVNIQFPDRTCNTLVTPKTNLFQIQAQTLRSGQPQTLLYGYLRNYRTCSTARSPRHNLPVEHILNKIMRWACHLEVRRALSCTVSSHACSKREGKLTSFSRLLHDLRTSALHCVCRALRLQLLALSIGTSGVQCSLESITLPAKHVIAMLSVAGATRSQYIKFFCFYVVDLRITSAVDQWLLGGVFRPQRLVVELSGIPHNLVHYLRKPDGMSGWASTSRLKRAGGWIGNVALVVSTVNVLSIPAPKFMF